MRVKQNSTAFIQKLFRDHNTGLLKFLTQKLSDPEEAADVAQTAYQKLLTLEQPDQLENAKGYLYQTAVNLAIDRIRKAGNRESHLRSLQPPDDPENLRNSPEAIVASRQQLERVDQAIKQLPEKCRRAFVMHRGEHLTYTEIAQTLGVSISMVEKYIIQALKHLRKL